MSQSETGRGRREKELAVIHVGKKELGWDDDTYRDALKAWTGKRSSGQMTAEERQTVIENMKRLGFTPASDREERLTIDEDDDPQVQKIKQLWLALHEEGAVKNPSLPSLNAFVRRMTMDEHVSFLSTSDANTVIEALKGWLTRTSGPGSGTS